MSFVRSVLAVIAGYLTMVLGVTTLFAFVMFVAFGGLPDRATFHPPGWLYAIELASAPFIAAVGGYVCAWIARRRQLQHAFALAGLGLLLGVVSALVDAGEKPLWSLIALPVLAALGVVLGARLRIHLADA